MTKIHLGKIHLRKANPYRVGLFRANKLPVLVAASYGGLWRDLLTGLLTHDARLPYVNIMALLDIVTVPDPKLREVSTEFETIDADAVRLAEDMLETMYDAPGIGLAAIQVGIPKKLFVVDIASDEEEPFPLVMFNPEIVKRDGDLIPFEEGCLSIPDTRIEVERPGLVVVEFTNREGKRQELTAEGLMSVVVQHEYDHLEGRLIIDYLSRLKRDMIIRKLRKQARDE